MAGVQGMLWRARKGVETVFAVLHSLSLLMAVAGLLTWAFGWDTTPPLPAPPPAEPRQDASPLP